MRPGPRWTAFLALFAVSVLLTVWFWPNGAFLFLVFPFFFPWRSRPSRACPACGWATKDPQARYCPRDATPLPT